MNVHLEMQYRSTCTAFITGPELSCCPTSQLYFRGPNAKPIQECQLRCREQRHTYLLKHPSSSVDALKAFHPAGTVHNVDYGDVPGGGCMRTDCLHA
jgi:hypothetical protein